MAAREMSPIEPEQRPGEGAMARNEGPSAHRVPALSPRAATASGRLFTIREQDEGRGGGGRPNRRWQHVPSSLKVAHDYRSPPSGKDTIRRGECGGRGDRDDGRGDSGSGGNRNLVGWGSGRVRGRDGGNSGGSGHGSDGKSGGGSGGSISGGGSGDGSCDIDGGGIGDSGSGGISHCRGGRDADVGGSVGHEPNQNGIAGVPVAKIVVEKRLRFEPKVNHSHGKQSHSKGVRKQRREAHGPRAVSVVLSKVSPGGSPTCKYAGGAVESARASSENGACLFVAGYVTSISARTTKCQERPSRAKPSRHIAASTPGRTRLEDRSSPESRANSTPPPAMANKAGTDNGGAKTDERVRLAKERRQELEKMQASRGELFQEKERKARELYERFMAERRRRLAEQRQREEERRVAVDEKRKQKLAEDKARYEASISRAQEKGPPRRDPRNRWSWGGAIPSNHTASPRKHLDNPDRRSVSTVNLSRHPPDSVVSKRLSMSSATLLNSPDRPGRRSQLTPMEMSIVSRLLTPTHSSLARSRSVATLSGEGHCPVFPVCPRSAFASPALTPTHSKQQHRHRSRSQERRFKPFSTPSPLRLPSRSAPHCKKRREYQMCWVTIGAASARRRSSPQTGGTTTPVTSGKTSGPLRANHPSPAATAAFVSSKPPSGPQTPRPRVDRKDVKDVKDVKEAKEAKEAKEGKEGKEAKEKKVTKDRKETKAEKERVNAATTKDEQRPAIAKKPKLSSPPAAGSKIATPNVAAPVSPLPPPPPSSPQTAGGTNAEDATRALAEKRKLAREQREKEEQERIAHAEAEKRMKEEIARRKAEERARREEEARRLEEERRVQEEEERRRAEEDRERREIEERERQVEIQKQREEAEVRAREEAEKQRVERARQAHKEEQERLERKKRLEQIMKRTRKSEPNKEKEGKDLEDAPDQQSNGDTGDSPGLLSLNGQTHAREAPTGNGSAAVGSLTTEGSNGRDFEELIDLAMEPRSMKAAVTTESGDAPADTVGSATTTAPPPNPPLIAFEENGDSLA
ncbi:unnamed protein product [Lampetra fluviatilis]